jgi:dinuclear metal center YbgI/SA1388 family protein
MKLREFISALDQIATLRYAETWDNVGLLAGDPQQAVTRAMLCIDYTTEVADEGRNLNCDCIIAYHPPLFDAVKRITADGPSSLIHDAIRRGVAIYSPHTALDVAEGGTNDMLADAIRMVERKPLRPVASKSTDCKLVTFVPENEVARVSDALFSAGAGWIGNYSQCSFRSAGTGTFFGETGTNPSVGEAGHLESVPEIRLETIVPIARASAVIAALRAVHSYEEPAFDLIPLAVESSPLGLGRVGLLASPTPVTELVDRIKSELGVGAILLAGGEDRLVERVAVCAGACGNLLDDAITAGAEFYLTGEMRHHDAIKAVRAGIAVVCTLHSNSERAVLKRLKSRLEELLTASDRPEILLSLSDRDPFSVR